MRRRAGWERGWTFCSALPAAARSAAGLCCPAASRPADSLRATACLPGHTPQRVALLLQLAGGGVEGGAQAVVAVQEVHRSGERGQGGQQQAEAGAHSAPYWLVAVPRLVAESVVLAGQQRTALLAGYHPARWPSRPA